MTEKKYQFTIVGKDEQECKQIATSLSTLYKNSTPADLIYLANKVLKKPSLIKKAVNALKLGLI